MSWLSHTTLQNESSLALRLLAVRVGGVLGTCALASVLVLALAHCGCTQSAISSVGLTVVDANERCPEEVMINYTVDAGPPRAATCALGIDDHGRCSCQVSLGEEEPGRFDIIVASADGERQGSTTVDVEDDTCHVDGRAAEITLQ